MAEPERIVLFRSTSLVPYEKVHGFAFSLDQRSIAYCDLATHGQGFDLVVHELESGGWSNTFFPLTDHTENTLVLPNLANGKVVVCQSDRIVLVNPESGGKTVLAFPSERNVKIVQAACSGTLLAIRGLSSSASESREDWIKILDVESARVTRTIHGASYPTFFPGGNRIAMRVGQSLAIADLSVE